LHMRDFTMFTLPLSLSPFNTRAAHIATHCPRPRSIANAITNSLPRCDHWNSLFFTRDPDLLVSNLSAHAWHTYWCGLITVCVLWKIDCPLFAIDLQRHWVDILNKLFYDVPIFQWIPPQIKQHYRYGWRCHRHSHQIRSHCLSLPLPYCI
jgi:hypothetical protein